MLCDVRHNRDETPPSPVVYPTRTMYSRPSRHGVALPHRSNAFPNVKTHPAPYGRLFSAVSKCPPRRILVRNRVHNSKSALPSVGEVTTIRRTTTTNGTVVDTQHRHRRCYHPGVVLPPRRSVRHRPWNHNNINTRNNAHRNIIDYVRGRL